MASLALLVSLMILSVILVGPVAYALSKIKRVPRPVVKAAGITAIAIGVLWLFCIPVGPVRLLGLFPAIMGWMAIR